MQARILLYTFYFEGIALPLKIEAPNQSEARQILSLILLRMPEYAHSRIIDELVESPVTGVTTKLHNGVRYLYVGFDQSDTGWKPLNELQ